MNVRETWKANRHVKNIKNPGFWDVQSKMAMINLDKQKLECQ